MNLEISGITSIFNIAAFGGDPNKVSERMGVDEWWQSGHLIAIYIFACVGYTVWWERWSPISVSSSNDGEQWVFV